MNQFETRCSSPRGFELSCRCTNHGFSTLARSNTRNGSTDTLQEAHPFVLVPHHPCSKAPDMIIDHHKPPSLVIRQMKKHESLPSLQHLFGRFCNLITYHLWSLTLEQLWTNLATMPERGSDGPSLHLPDLLNSNHTTPDMFTYFSNSRESRN